MTTELFAVSDVVLDIHAGEPNEDLLPFVCYYDNKEEPYNTKMAHRLSFAANMQYVVSYPYHLKKTDKAEYAFKQAVQDGKIGFSIELGKLGQCSEEDVSNVTASIMRVLKEFGSLTSSLSAYPNVETKQQVQHIFLNNQTYIKVPQEGVFHSNIKSGESITKGQYLGAVCTPSGRKLCDIYAPVSGIVLYKIGTPPVNQGETLFCIGSE